MDYIKIPANKFIKTKILTKLKEDLDNKSVSKNVVIQIGSSTTKIGDNDNYALSIRRSNSIYLYIMSKIKNNVTNNNKRRSKRK